MVKPTRIVDCDFNIFGLCRYEGRPCYDYPECNGRNGYGEKRTEFITNEVKEE